MHRYIFIILIFLTQTAHAQKSDLEGRGLSGKVKVYKQVTHDIHSFTHGVNSASTDSLFSYYDKKGKLTKYVGYRKSCWVEKGDTSHRESTVFVSNYESDSKLRRRDTGYSYDYIKHDTDYHANVYHLDEEGHLVKEETNFWFPDRHSRYIERYTRKNGKMDSVIAYAERSGEKPVIETIKKWTYGTLTDTMTVYSLEDIKFKVKVIVLNSPTGRREMVTKYNADKNYTESTEYYLYSDEEKEPEYKELMTQKNDHRNGYVIFTTRWHKDKQGNYLRTTTHKEETLHETYFEIEYYK